MCEAGHSWRRAFAAHPEGARSVRCWTAVRAEHPDAPLVAGELFIAVLGTGPDVIEVTISTAGSRTRLVATGSASVPVLFTEGHGEAIVRACTTAYGVSGDARSLWADLNQKRS